MALAVPLFLGAATTGIGQGSIRSLASSRPASAEAAERVFVVRASRSSFDVATTTTTIAGPARVRPARGAVTSPFGERRGGHRHPGVDLDGNTGDPVVAAAAGRVVVAGSAPAGFHGYGLLVVLDHGGDVQSMYAHLSAVAVHAGDVVAAGQRIGSVGATGEATGSHLHFEVHVGGRLVDPLRWLAGR